MKSRHLHLLAAVVALLVLLTNPAIAQNGIFADFVTTEGDFRVELNYEKTPLTVANFVGLIEGTQPYIDLNTGSIKHGNFYDGITFHRVISGFMIQGGSPNGQGTDGPGYSFRDEFDATLRHNNHVISMANSGPDSNGSQFFITVSTRNTLDDKHSVFGAVASGGNVVDAISNVPVTGTTPNTPVVITSIRIDRVGTAAQAWDSPAQGLPFVGYAESAFHFTGADSFLNFDRQINRQYTLYAGSNLEIWTSEALPFSHSNPPGPDHNVNSYTSGQHRHFFRVTRTDHPGVIAENLYNKRLTLNAERISGTSNPATIVYEFNAQVPGTATDYGSATLNGGSVGVISDYIYNLQPNSSVLHIASSALNTLYNIALRHDTATSGFFNGNLGSSTGSVIYGTFTLEDLP